MGICGQGDDSIRIAVHEATVVLSVCRVSILEILNKQNGAKDNAD